MRPRILDLFCCAGGAAVGYHLAGFEVVGIDKDPRHRLFETSFSMMVPACHHGVWTVKRFPGTPRFDGSRPLSRIVNPMASECGHEDFAAAMGIDWMPARGFRPSRELLEAIPPAYTEHIGGYLMAALSMEVAA